MMPCSAGGALLLVAGILLSGCDQREENGSTASASAAEQGSQEPTSQVVARLDLEGVPQWATSSKDALQRVLDHRDPMGATTNSAEYSDVDFESVELRTNDQSGDVTLYAQTTLSDGTCLTLANRLVPVADKSGERLLAPGTCTQKCTGENCSSCLLWNPDWERCTGSCQCAEGEGFCDHESSQSG